MAAPGIPDFVAVAFRGHVQRSGTGSVGRQAALITWERPAGPPDPIEHYELFFNGGGADVLWATTGAAATSQLADLGALPTPWGALNDVKVRAVNTDGASAKVSIDSFYPTTLIPVTADDVAEAGSVAVGTITNTTAIVSWTTSDTDTRASVWVIRLMRGSSYEVELTVPFWQLTRTLTGLLPGHAYQVQVFARYLPTGYAGSSDVQLESPPQPETAVEFTTTTDEFELTGPAEIESAQNGVVAGSYEAPAAGIISWALSGAPAGVLIEAREDFAMIAADITGTATEPGIYDAVVTGRYRASTGDMILSLPVRFIVSGGAFLPWFHDEPARRELQIDVRTRQVTSATFDLASEEGMVLVYRDLQRVHILFRDGTRVLDTVPTALRLIMRPPEQFPGEPFIREVWAADVESIGGEDRAYFDLTPGSDELDGIFAELDAASGRQPGSAALAGLIEIEWTFAAAPARTSRPVPAQLAQDYEQ